MSTTNTLNWSKNTEADLAGYNVYRNLGSAPVKGPAIKINVGMVAISTPTYVDTVSSDGDYFYAVSAVDNAGNESPFSTAVEKVVNVVPPVAPTGLTVQ
jgi:fibronectin type 3 domain-containing protein